MKKNRIEAVVFDLDGVITDTANYHFSAWKELANELGIVIDKAFNEKLKGISRLDSLELILEKGNRKHAFTSKEKEELADRKNDVYREQIKQLTPADILPGINRLLGDIQQGGIPLGLASVSRNAAVVLKSLELEGTFDYCADAAFIRRSKPDPEIFLTVCRALGADPQYSIGIEDAAAGIQAIKSSSMFAVGVGLSLDQADYRVNETEQLHWETLKAAFQKWTTIK